MNTPEGSDWLNAMLYSLWLKVISRAWCPIRDREWTAWRPAWSSSGHCLTAQGLQTVGLLSCFSQGHSSLNNLQQLFSFKPVRASKANILFGLLLAFSLHSLTCLQLPDQVLEIQTWKGIISKVKVRTAYEFKCWWKEQDNVSCKIFTQSPIYCTHWILTIILWPIR